MRLTKTWAEWLAANPPPDLQTLAEYYGGVGAIPEDIWRKYQTDLVSWQKRRQDRRLEY
jgi:hypothetical protein